MKSIILCSFLLIFGYVSHCQSPSWQWAQSGQGVPEASGTGIQTDGAGNIYVSGIYYGNFIGFGNDTLYNADTSGYNTHMFILKYNPDGALIWAKNAGSSNSGNLWALHIDAAGNIYLGGYFDGLLVIQTDTLYVQQYFYGTGTSFVAKFDASGNFMWVKPTYASMNLWGLATDANSNIYFTGYYQDTAVIWGNDTLASANPSSRQVYIAKFDSLGNESWAKGFGGNSDQYGYAIATDASGNSYITGAFASDTITIGNNTLANSTTDQDFSAFTVKYDRSGNVVWAKVAGGTVKEVANDVALDAQGNAYISGICYSSTVNFDAVTIINPDTGGNGNMFVAKYDTAGAIVWAKSSATTNTDISGAGVSASTNGDIYVSGNFRGRAVIFGTDTFLNENTANWDADIFIAAYDDQGNFIRATSAGGTNQDICNSIATDARGNAYITGNCSSPVMYFGTDSVYGTDDEESDNIFIAKYGTMATGIANAPRTAENILVYPNPSASQFYFKGINPGSILEVYNVMGQEISSALVENSTYLLNMNNNARGIYFYRVIDKNTAVQQGKIILE